MKLIGIPLRRPTSNELTAAAVMAVGLWLAGVGLLRALHMDLGRGDARALLLVATWGCVSARVGIRVGKGHRHLAANLLVTALLLGCYEAARAFTG